MTLDDIIKIKYVDEGYMADYPPHLLSKDEMCEAFLPARPLPYGQVDGDTVLWRDKGALSIDASDDGNPVVRDGALNVGTAYRDPDGNLAGIRIDRGPRKGAYSVKGDMVYGDAELAKEASSFFCCNYVCTNPDLQEAYEQLKSAIRYHIGRYLDKIDPVEPPMWVYSYMLGEVVCGTSDPRDRHDILTAFDCDNVADEFDAQAQQFCYDVSRRFCQKLPKDERELVTGGQVQLLRPPTIFGEPHVIKSIRIGSAYEVR